VAELTYDLDRDELVPFVPLGASSLLDIGCGAGRYGAAVRRSRPEIELWAVEPDPPHAEAARTKFDHLVMGGFPDVVDELPRAHFDVVTFNDVLEHLVDPAAAITATRPLLAPGGRVVASIPNVRHFSVVWPLVRHGTWTYHEAGLLDRTHLRWFTKKSMTKLFTDLGWSVEAVVGVNRRVKWWHPDETWQLRTLRRVVGSRLDDFFYVQYVVTARPS
jgi:2-polyprenyl-3-methyl-5-hydroxy-6-metoxy-1,4-benzoquinol methylase